MSFTQAQVESFLAMALGFAIAGLVAAIYRAIRDEHVSFHLLLIGGPTSIAAIPLLAITGPAIIMRNTVRGRKYEKRKVHFVAMATVLASLWSILIGYLVMDLF
jgi:hypothetical protein